MLVSEHGILFNTSSDTVRAHDHPDLSRVMHVFDAYWHGIRSATACLPGHKVAISHKMMADDDAVRHLLGYISHYGISKVCFQAMSENAVALAGLIKQEFGASIDLYVVTHVSSAQFENHFEMRMIKTMVDAQKKGLFTRLGSVKPRFHGVVPSFWNGTIVNAAPNIPVYPVLREIDSVLLPVENNWRKNLYTNALAAIHCEDVRQLYVVNWPNAMENLVSMDKLRWVGFMRPDQMLARAGSCAAVMHSSLIECQPMTMLEAMAVGTPCVSGPLGIHPEIDAHPLTALCEVQHVDDVGGLTSVLRNIIGLWQNDADGLRGMIADHLTLRKKLCFDSYLEFLD